MQLFDEQVVIGVGSHVMTVGQDIVRLSQPPRLGAGGLQVPLDLVTKTLGQALHYDFIWSQEDLRLFAMPQQAHDVDVAWNLVHLQGISTLVVQFSERPRYRIEEGDTFVLVELLGGERAVVSERRPPVDPLISGIFFEGSAIRIRKTPGAIVEHYEQDRPFRLVFDLYQRQETRALPGSTPTSTRRLIVLDPGHGGSETGAIGPSGVEEKALTLQIARTLARRLETRLPVRVVLTRDEDADLAHDRRTAIANQQQADLFISIHLNSSVGSRAQGAETYFSSLEATDAAAAAAAHTENSSGLESDEALADLQLILWDLSQSRYLTQSQRLGTLVQGELNQALGLKDRGVKQAPFRVLLGAAMPAVLVELGFISNPEEETKLRRVSYQAELVDALVRAVSRFYGEEEAVNSGSPSSTSTSSSEVP
jgi:N-acetylmuramoyl-L-alanine amidase